MFLYRSTVRDLTLKPALKSQNSRAWRVGPSLSEIGVTIPGNITHTPQVADQSLECSSMLGSIF